MMMIIIIVSIMCMLKQHLVECLAVVKAIQKYSLFQIIRIVTSGSWLCQWAVTTPARWHDSWPSSILLQVMSAMCTHINLSQAMFWKLVGQPQPCYASLEESRTWEMGHSLYKRWTQWNQGSFCASPVTELESVSSSEWDVGDCVTLKECTVTDRQEKWSCKKRISYTQCKVWQLSTLWFANQQNSNHGNN
jgi:hypothetical protein